MAPGSKKAKDVTHKADYKIHEVVLAKMKGFPAWPAWISSDELAPHKVVKQKPRVGKYLLCAFFNDDTYFWAPPRDVKPLTKQAIDEYLSADSGKREGKEVRGAYEAARDPEAHIREKESLAYRDNNQADEEAEGQDELAEDDEVDEGEASAGSKRKRIKDKIKSKLPGAKKQKKEKDGASTSAAKSAAAPKKKPRPSEAITEAGDDGDNDEPASPETKKVKNWRHQLQRAFLGKTPPKESEMAQMAEIFTQVEEHQMSEEALKLTKIGKVMKKITQSKDEIPRESEFKFKERAEELCKKWKNISSAEGGGGADSPAQDKPAPAAAAAATDAKPPSSKETTEAAPAANGSSSAETGASGAEQDKPEPAPKEKEESKAEAAAPAAAAPTA